MFDAESPEARLHVAWRRMNEAEPAALLVQANACLFLAGDLDAVYVAHRMNERSIVDELHLTDELRLAIDLDAEFLFEDTSDCFSHILFVKSPSARETPSSFVRLDRPFHDQHCAVRIDDSEVKAQSRHAAVIRLILIVSQPICGFFQRTPLFWRVLKRAFLSFCRVGPKLGTQRVSIAQNRGFVKIKKRDIRFRIPVLKVPICVRLFWCVVADLGLGDEAVEVSKERRVSSCKRSSGCGFRFLIRHGIPIFATEMNRPRSLYELPHRL